MYVFTPHTDTSAPPVTMSVAYPNAFAPYSAKLKSSSGLALGTASLAALTGPDVDVDAVGTTCGTTAFPPVVAVLRGGGGASFSALLSTVNLCLRRSTTGTASAAVVRASWASVPAWKGVSERGVSRAEAREEMPGVRARLGPSAEYPATWAASGCRLVWQKRKPTCEQRRERRLGKRVCRRHKARASGLATWEPRDRP